MMHALNGLEFGAILVLLHYYVICFLLSIRLTMIYDKSSTLDSLDLTKHHCFRAEMLFDI